MTSDERQTTVIAKCRMSTVSAVTRLRRTSRERKRLHTRKAQATVLHDFFPQIEQHRLQWLLLHRTLGLGIRARSAAGRGHVDAAARTGPLIVRHA